MKKKICVEIWKGYCPNRIVRGWIVLPHGEVYCNRKAWWAGKIVLQDTQGVLQDSECSGFKTVLQYSLVDNRCIAIQLLYCRLERA